MKLKTLVASALLAGFTAGNAYAAPELLITEIMSKSDTTEDWFEITNVGDATADITGWQYDDESAEIADAAALVGITSIAAGESVVFVGDTTDAAFRAYWGGLLGVQVGTFDGAGLGKGDGITLFDASDAIVLQQFYGDGDATDPTDLIADTHAGAWNGGADNDSAVWLPSSGSVSPAFDSAIDGVLGAYVAPGGADQGSPGVVPEPASMVLAALGGIALLSRRG